jgi:hypothetical protein
MLIPWFVGCGGDPPPAQIERTAALTLSSASIPTCDWQLSTRDYHEWYTQSVQVHDSLRYNDYIGRCNAEEGAWFDKWRPVNNQEMTLCGLFDKYDFYRDDGDWNLSIVPNEAHTGIIEGAYDGRPPHDLGDCAHGLCMQAELQPDQGYSSNPWFSSTGGSPLLGREVCVFGPWVKDCGHDCKPEIHPSQAIWWRDPPPSPGYPEAIHFLAIQDNSGRFDDRNDFDCNGHEPPGFRGWSDSPVGVTFRIPFDLDPSRGETKSIDILEITRRFVVTSSDPNRSHDGEQRVVYDGRTLLEVNELIGNDDDLGTSIVDVCRNPYDNHVVGFVNMNASLGGNDDRGEEGYFELLIQR